MVDTPDKLLDMDFPYRFILSTETDANSPDNEVTYGQMRLNFEAFFKNMGGVIDTGTVVQNPNDLADGLLLTEGINEATDSLVGRLVVMQTGDAIGNVLFITANSYSGSPFFQQTLTLSHNLDWTPGDPLTNLWALGVRSIDAIAVTYHAFRSGHNHDGINSAVLGPDSIGLVQLKIVPTTVQGFGAVAMTAGAQYSFYPGFRIVTGPGPPGGDMYVLLASSVPTAPPFYGATFQAYSVGGWTSYTGEISYRYVTASGEVNWIFILKDKETGAVIGFSAASDHPCFGNGSPDKVPHPFPQFDPEIHEIIVANPSMSEWRDIQLATYPTMDGGYLNNNKLLEAVDREKQRGKNRGNPYTSIKDITRSLRGFGEAFDSIYSIGLGKEAVWPTKPVSVVLPDFDNDGNLIGDWRTVPTGTLVAPIKMKIPKPEYIKVRALKKISPAESKENLEQQAIKIANWYEIHKEVEE